jgi:hypothetical protein
VEAKQGFVRGFLLAVPLSHPVVLWLAVKVFCWFGQHMAGLYGPSEGWTQQDFFSFNAKAST